MVKIELTITRTARSPHHQEAAVPGEYLNAIVTTIENLKIARLINCQTSRIVELVRLTVHVPDNLD